jgi:hypothetical protein
MPMLMAGTLAAALSGLLVLLRVLRESLAMNTHSLKSAPVEGYAKL